MENILKQIIVVVLCSAILSMGYAAYAQSENGRIDELEKRISALEQMVITLNQKLTELSQEIKELKSSGATSDQNLQSAQIEGIVKDAFGKGLEGVSVRILQSTFQAETDQNGKYSIDYIPGSFTISFTKKGYTTHELKLTIQEKAKYPAESLIMYPIPPGKGIYYIGDEELKELPPCVIKNDHKVSMTNPHDIYFALSKNGLIIKAGQAAFIDTSSKRLQLMLLRPDSRFYSHTYGEKPVYYGLLKEQIYTVGKEALTIRTTNFAVANYAWIEYKRSTDNYGIFYPQDDGGACYSLYVRPPGD